MNAGPEIVFDPKVNFELPGEIGPLLEQAAAVSIAETQDACFELEMATQEAAANLDRQLAVVQTDAKDLTMTLLAVAAENIDTAFRYALKLAQARSIQDYFQIQIEFLRTQPLVLLRQAQDLSRPIVKAAMHS